MKAGWGISVVPRLLVQHDLERGELVNVAPHFALPIALYWHCWNLESEVLDALSAALQHAADQALVPVP